MFGPTRKQLGLKSRRKKTGRLTVRYSYPDGTLIDEEIDVAEFPPLYIGFRWPAPGILLGRAPNNHFTGELIVRCNTAQIQAHATETQAFRIGRVGPHHFARMLAKIAHAFTVAKYGIDAFDPLLPPLILGESDQAPYFVGGDGSGPPPHQPNILH